MTEDLAGLVEAVSRLGLALDADQRSRFEAYAALLLDWNERFNLVGPAAVRELWSRHLFDACTFVLALPPDLQALGEPLSLIDVGTGAGLPGIPLQILFPHWQVSLLEVTTKKLRFLEVAREELDLSNLLVVPGRAEDVAHDRDHREAYDLATARAVTHTAGLVELTLPFVVVGGHAILYRGLATLGDELQDAETARVVLGAAAPAVIPVSGGGDEGRCLVRYAKRSRTPAQLPRAAGLPEHRPLTLRDVQQIREQQEAARQRRLERRAGSGRRVRR